MNPKAFAKAKEIIASLAEDQPMPVCCVEPDGCISLDWMPAPYRTLSVSAGESNLMPYAWVDGVDRGHAVGRLQDGMLSGRLLEEIQRFSPASQAPDPPDSDREAHSPWPHSL